MDNKHCFPPIEKAKSALGSYEAIGRVCGISGKAVMKWARSGRMPRTEWTGETQYSLAIERATHGAVTREELRPDIFGSLSQDQGEITPQAQDPKRESA